MFFCLFVKSCKCICALEWINVDTYILKKEIILNYIHLWINGFARILITHISKNLLYYINFKQRKEIHTLHVCIQKKNNNWISLVATAYKYTHKYNSLTYCVNVKFYCIVDIW